MDLRTWLIINAFIALFFGLMLILAPRKLTAPFGIKLDDVGMIFARGIGSAILGMAVINWAARDYTELSIVWSVVAANIILHTVGGYADLKATLDKTYTNAANGWGSVVFHFAIALVFAYYLVFTR